MFLIAADAVPVAGDVPAVEIVLRLAGTLDRPPHVLRMTGESGRLRIIAQALIGAADTADAASRAIERVEGKGGEVE